MTGRARPPLVVAVILLCAALAGRAGATGEHTLSTFFEYRSHGDFPLEDFVAGRLGVLQPELRRDHLALAFRALRGPRLDARERAGALELLRARLRLPADTALARKGGEARVAAWLKARLLVKGASPASAIDAYKESALWVEYANCLPDAFDSAARALRERVTRLGAGAIEVRGWLAAQDRVFAACGPPRAGPPGSPAPAPPPLPEELPETAPASTRADRDYQIAAAHFYGGHFEEAAERFHRIARQAGSPWAPLGNYLAARALIRKASLGPASDRVALLDAEHELSTLLAAAGEDEAARDRVQRLLSLVEARLHPEEQVRALARRVARGSRDLRNDLGDYLWLLSRTRPDAATPEEPLLDLDRLRADDELTDWVLTVAGARRGEDDDARRASTTAAFAHALSRHRAAPDVAWLLAALMLAPGGRGAAGPEVGDLVDAALRLPDGSPAHDTAVYHALRLQLDSEQPERVAAARKRLDALLPALRAARPSSTLNRFLALRLRAAASLDEVVDFAQRFALGAGREDDDLEVPDDLAGPGRRRPQVPRLDDDGAALLRTRLPLALLLRLLDQPRLAEGLKAELTRALLVRAVALEDGAAVQKLLPAAAALVAEPPAWREGIEAMAAAAGDDERAFAATLMMLRLPGLRPWVDAGLGRQAPLSQKDEFRDNWWCAPGSEGVLRSRAASPPLTAPPVAFLSDAERKAAEAELARLERVGTGANAMAARTLDFARTHPDDPRLPEALFLVNRATHYGCTDDKTSGWSKQAYLALHRQWPRSEWARRVKYWW